MAEEEKPKQLVQMSTVIASGITAIVAALLTSRLGVAGTLIGTALTPMLMTIGVAVLNAQIEKATDKISDLPSTVRSRLPTQRVRVPGTPTPGETPEETEPPVAPRRRDMRTPGVFERVLSIPTYLKEMSPSTRRRTLLTGILTGLVAAAIGLAGVTGIEAASGSSFSCTMWEKCGETTTTASGQETEQASTSLTQVFGGSSGAETESVPSDVQEQPADVQQQEAQPAPQVQQAPQEQQYQVTPQGGDQQSGEAPEQPPVQPVPQEEEQPAVAEPGAVPQDGSQEPSVDPGAEQQPATPPEQQPVTPPEQQPATPPEQQ